MKKIATARFYSVFTKNRTLHQYVGNEVRIQLLELGKLECPGCPSLGFGLVLHKHGQMECFICYRDQEEHAMRTYLDHKETEMGSQLLHMKTMGFAK